MTRPTIVSVHQACGISGVATWAARVIDRAPNWRMLVVGPNESRDLAMTMPASDHSRCAHAFWSRGSTPGEQIAHVRDALVGLGAQAVLPNDVLQASAATALLADTPPRLVALAHSDDLIHADAVELAAPALSGACAVSESALRRISPLLGDVPSAVIPCGVPLPKKPSARSLAEPFRLLYVSRLDRAYKRSLDLVALADSLTTDGLPFVLDIVGDGPAFHQLCERMREHVRGGRVVLHGRLDDSQIASLRAGAHLGLLVSEREGAPLTIMEALSDGLPVAITSGSGGVVTPVRTHRAGVVAPTGDMATLAREIRALLSSSDRYAQACRSARELAESAYDITSTTRDLERLIARADRKPSIEDRWRVVRRIASRLGTTDEAQLHDLARDLCDRAGRDAGIDPSGQTLIVGGVRLDLTPAGESSPAARLVEANLADLAETGAEHIALYGAGAHTKRLCETIRGTERIVAIIDDRAHEPDGPDEVIGGVPVVSPSEIGSLPIDGVIISSDEHERDMLERARAWAGRLPIRTLYTDAA